MARVRQWSVPDVAAWLHECHMGQYAQLFADNDIQGAALLQLDQAALKEMGLTSLGDRLRILAAIRALHKRSIETTAQRPANSRTNAPLGIAGHNARARPSGEWVVSQQEPDVVRHPSPTPLVFAPQPMSRIEPEVTVHVTRVPTPSGRAAGAHPTGRRPNTATGVSSSPWHTPASSTTAPTSPTTPMPRTRRPATATSASQNVGYAVGRGAFAPSVAVKQRTMQISAPYNLRRADSESDSDSTRGNEAVSPAGASFKGMRRALIKFFAEDGTSRVVDVSECHYAYEVLMRVLRKFGLPKHGADLEATEYMNKYAFAMTGIDGKPKVLSENELMAVCSMPHAYTPVWQNGLYLIEMGTPLPDVAGAREEGATRRASTLSILSGLGVENLPPERSPSPTRTSLAWRAARPARAVAAAATEPLRPATKVKRRVRNFFGQRPPSELISSHLAEYFPTTDSRELQRHSRTSFGNLAAITAPSPTQPQTPISPTVADGGRALPPMRRFPPELAAENEAASPRSPAAPAAPAADDAASLITVDEITQDLEERNAIQVEPAPRNAAADDQQGSHGTPEHPAHTASKAPERAPERAPEHAPERTVSPAAAPAPAPASAPAPAPSVRDAVSGDTAAPPRPRIRWHKGALIGAGSFGKVFLGMNAKTGLLMAVKQVELATTDEANTQRRKFMVESLESEIKLLKTIQHPNIVHYLDSYADGEYLNIFLEYVPGGSVVSLLRNYGAFEEQLVQNFVRQVLQGLDFLHTQAIVHRDIKGANILVDNKGGVKISDFGISKKVESGLMINARGQRGMLQGSVYWMAPEVVKQTSYTPKADIWSVGCLIVEMLTAQHPWPKLDQMQALFQIGMRRTPEVPSDISTSAADFLHRTFAVEEDDRPSAAALLHHVFITQPTPDGAGDT